MTKKVILPTIQENFVEAVRLHALPQLAHETPEKQAAIIRSRINLGILQGFAVSTSETGSVQFELGKGHFDNRYISKLDLPLIKSAFALIAQDRGISDAAIQSVMIVKQPGVIRDKVVAFLPNQEFLEQLTAGAAGSESIRPQVQSVFGPTPSPHIA